MLSLTLRGRMLFVHLGGTESADRVGGFLALTANTKPTLTRRALHHGVHVLSHAHHSPPQRWLLNYGISLLVWVTSHRGIGWAEVINTEENFNRWTFAVNTGWLMTDLLVLQCWFLRRLIASIWPFILPSDSQGKITLKLNCKVWRALQRLLRVSLDQTRQNGETNLIYAAVTANLRGSISAGRLVAPTSSYK